MLARKLRAVPAAAVVLLAAACSDTGLMAEAARGPISRFSGPPPLDAPGAPPPPRLLDLPNSTTGPVAAAAPRAPDPNPGQPLFGLATPEVVATLGPAGFVRRDGPAEIWRYSASPCFLDVFFYRENDGQRVNYVAARSRIGNRTITTEDCYRALIAERRGVPVG